MYAYRVHVDRGLGLFDRGIEELGPRSLADVKALVASASVQEGAVTIGFYRSDTKDFVEISCLGNDQYLVWSDRITAPRSLFARLFGSRHIERIVQGDDEAFEAVKFYVERPRTEFEEKYYRALGDRARL